MGGIFHHRHFRWAECSNFATSRTCPDNQRLQLLPWCQSSEGPHVGEGRGGTLTPHPLNGPQLPSQMETAASQGDVSIIGPHWPWLNDSRLGFTARQNQKKFSTRDWKPTFIYVDHNLPISLFSRLTSVQTHPFSAADSVVPLLLCSTYCFSGHAECSLCKLLGWRDLLCTPV